MIGPTILPPSALFDPSKVYKSLNFCMTGVTSRLLTRLTSEKILSRAE
jgi:hypothetical protein